MEAREAMRKELVAIAPDAPVHEAATLMDRHAVGALVVMEEERLLGIVTDRDLVVRGVARQLPVDARVDSVMTPDPIVLDAHADLRAALPIFRTHAFRRLPLVDGDRVVGLLTVDDLLVDLIADLGDVVRPVTGEVIFGHPDLHQAPVPTG